MKGFKKAVILIIFKNKKKNLFAIEKFDERKGFPQMNGLKNLQDETL
jgi:hypothetical protein